MSLKSLLSTVRALALLALAAAATSANATSTQLSAGLPFSAVHFASTPPQISPDGLFAVYVQDAVINGANELWSVPLAGGNPVRLSDALVSGQSVKFAISADSAHVVYIVDQETPGDAELFSIPIAGPAGAEKKLNMDLPINGAVIDFLISPTSDRVYYRADGESHERFELWRVDITGGVSTRLNAEVSNAYDIFEFAVGLTTGGSERVVYRVGRTTVGGHELWSVPATGTSESAVRISRPLVNSGGVERYFQISPDGTRVVYLADALVDEAYNIYSVAIGGGTSTQLNGALLSAADVEADFVIDADSARVVYRSDEGTDNVIELYSVPLTGGVSTLLNPILPTGGDVAEHAISPNSARVVYRADQSLDGLNELWSVPLGGGTATRLNGTLPANGDVLDFAISPDSTRVVYLADQNVDTLNELWSVPLGGAATTRLNRTLATNGDVQAFLISPDSNWVVYGADQDADAVDKLLRVPIAGGTVEGVSGPLVAGGDVVLTFLTAPVFEISPTNSYDVLYAADKDVDGQIELFLSGEPEEDEGACTPTATSLCLQDDKFRVSVSWRDFEDGTGSGQATQLSNESGDFWFFDAQSNELIVKIIDACASTGNYWVFWRALSNVEMDLVIHNTGTLQNLIYHNPLGYRSNGHLDIDTIFRCDGSGPAEETVDTSTDLPAPGNPNLIEFVNPILIDPCVPDGDRTICLQGGRFRVQGSWSDFAGGSGNAHLIKKNESSGYAWFFNSNNYEMLFKVVDACSYNGNTWVFIAGLTNVEARLTIRDTWTGTVYRQENALGVDFPTNLDIETNLDYCGPSPF